MRGCQHEPAWRLRVIHATGNVLCEVVYVCAPHRRVNLEFLLEQGHDVACRKHSAAVHADWEQL